MQIGGGCCHAPITCHGTEFCPRCCVPKRMKHKRCRDGTAHVLICSTPSDLEAKLTAQLHENKIHVQQRYSNNFLKSRRVKMAAAYSLTAEEAEVVLVDALCLCNINVGRENFSCLLFFFLGNFTVYILGVGDMCRQFLGIFGCVFFFFCKVCGSCK